MNKTFPAIFFDTSHRESQIMSLEGIRVSDFYREVDSTVLITDRRIISMPRGMIRGSAAALDNPDNYYDIKEIADIRSISFSTGLTSFVNLTFKNGRDVQLYTFDQVEALLSALRPLVSQPAPLLWFPEGETVLFKSGPGIHFLPDMTITERRDVFWTAGNIQMVVTDRRILFYRVNQIGKFTRGALGVDAEFRNPSLQFISIPLQDIVNFSVAKGMLSGVVLKLNKRIHGFELGSLSVFPVDDLIFEQHEYTCKHCGKSFRGGKLDSEPAVDLEGYVCGRCGAPLCAGSVKQGFFSAFISNHIHCPACREKAAPAAYVVSSRFRVTARGSLENAFPELNRAELYVSSMGKDGKAWDLRICESKWQDLVVPALQQALTGEEVADQPLINREGPRGEAVENSHRTVYNFPIDREIWPVVDAWAKKHGYSIAQPGEANRVYQKGNINWSAPTMLEISLEGDCGHLEAWLMFDEAANKLTGSSFEMPLKSGGLRAAGKRKKAREEVNDLLKFLGLPTIG